MAKLTFINIGPQFEANARYRSKKYGYTPGYKCRCGAVDNLPCDSFDFADPCPKCGRKDWLPPEKRNEDYIDDLYDEKGKLIELRNNGFTKCKIMWNKKLKCWEEFKENPKELEEILKVN